ncbi:hypothetical protein ACOTWR_06730 [Aliarcobacter butzleri]|uniref:hypothetical protein n=1 Tax=Aliarcobacter butzleri TaxID=28197 RepID=UPI0021B64129|nr:hypothetical protein [Aliarcobacter butzleri]MCT7578743.1 hypothetical protein [Aliarcobacter butzleri]
MFYRYIIVLFITLTPAFIIQASDIPQKYIYTSLLLFAAVFGLFINYYKEHPKVHQFLKEYF